MFACYASKDITYLIILEFLSLALLVWNALITVTNAFRMPITACNAIKITNWSEQPAYLSKSSSFHSNLTFKSPISTTRFSISWSKISHKCSTKVTPMSKFSHWKMGPWSSKEALIRRTRLMSRTPFQCWMPSWLKARKLRAKKSWRASLSVTLH